MATLEGKTVLIIGGSSGIGFGVAKASLLSQALRVIIASSSPEKVKNAVGRLEDAIAGKGLPGDVVGKVVDAKDSASIKGLFLDVGEIDHLVWTSGDALPANYGFPGVDLDSIRGSFDVRFWGPAIAAQAAKIRLGGSITLTVGSLVVKPKRSMAIAAGIGGAPDSLTRGLAVDLAPIRVNAISPGFVNTELWDSMPSERREKIFSEVASSLLLKHVAEPDEIAEAYLFVMKCGFITGQRIEVDGGDRFS